MELTRLFNRLKDRNIYFYKLLHKIRMFEEKSRKKQFDKYTRDVQMKMLSKEYEEKTGQTLDWNNLQTYTEKMQWSKLFDNSPIKTKLTDKYMVREWVSDKIGEEFLIPLLGVWDSFEEIDFSSLPDRFVLKTNNASGTNMIVNNKKGIDFERARILFERWLSTDYSSIGGFQMQYKNIKPKIVAEKYIVDSNGQLFDYKFLCFNGKVYYCWVDVDRQSVHKRNVYDLNWNLQSWNQYKYDNTEDKLGKPENFEEMIRVAEVLCEGFSHVRVDLYNVDGKIYFGEMTFTNGNGYELIYPHSKNLELGNLW